MVDGRSEFQRLEVVRFSWRFAWFCQRLTTNDQRLPIQGAKIAQLRPPYLASNSAETVLLAKQGDYVAPRSKIPAWPPMLGSHCCCASVGGHQFRPGLDPHRHRSRR